MSDHDDPYEPPSYTAKLSDCPYKPGTDPWKRWQREFMSITQYANGDVARARAVHQERNAKVKAAVMQSRSKLDALDEDVRELAEGGGRDLTGLAGIIAGAFGTQAHPSYTAWRRAQLGRYAVGLSDEEVDRLFYRYPDWALIPTVDQLLNAEKDYIQVMHRMQVDVLKGVRTRDMRIMLGGCWHGRVDADDDGGRPVLVAPKVRRRGAIIPNPDPSSIYELEQLEYRRINMWMPRPGTAYHPTALLPILFVYSCDREVREPKDMTLAKMLEAKGW